MVRIPSAYVADSNRCLRDMDIWEVCFTTPDALVLDENFEGYLLLDFPVYENDELDAFGEVLSPEFSMKVQRRPDGWVPTISRKYHRFDVVRESRADAEKIIAFIEVE